MDTRRKQVLSCIQPTGSLHIGRYLGALRNWVALQSQYDCVYGIVDYHAMTMPFVPGKLREATWELAVNMAAIGIDPDNIFVQSMIPEHAELAWIFNCVTSYGELGRMVQFKDKSQQVTSKDKDAFISAGLFTYPVLQAADILIYRADYVPVGDDQDQHLELARNIAQRFNNIVGKEYFVLPETLHTETPRIMSTADPLIKMSASKGEKHNINVFADPEKIRKQVRSAVTDTGEADWYKMSPGIENLFIILKAGGSMDTYTRLKTTYASGLLKYVELKDAVADAVVEMTNPFREKRQAILADKRAFKDRIRASSEVIREKAQKTLREVKELVGLMQSK
ncbi:MAG TPA: tryptophan--tRNA ligase [Saprospiraceae bacterium]|nr:tryptophan--tRNA ligase [Saprospiraceae bacterium]